MTFQITEFQLPLDINTFCNSFWYSTDWYERFLVDCLKDTNVHIGEWKDHEDSGKIRDIKSAHPSTVSFPGLPSHADSFKVQKLIFNSDNLRMTILESNTFNGIPMSDYFRVDTMWHVEELNSKSDCSSSNHNATVQIHITAEVVFTKSTWLRGTIESNTKAELQVVYSTWKDEALRYIRKCSETPEMMRQPSELRLPPLFSLAEEDLEVRSPTNLSRVQSMGSRLDSEDEFYDCEEGIDNYDDGDGGDEKQSLLHDVFVRQRLMRLTSPYLHPPGDDGIPGARDTVRPVLSRHLLTPQELIDMYGTITTGTDSNGLQDTTRIEKPFGRYVAATVAEVLFVLVESLFWQLHNIYKYDLKELFVVDPLEVIRRMLCSFVPGTASSLLVSPDLYGPCVAAFALPQVLLLAMDSSHHGCSRSSLLGDAVVVSLCLWGGLSSFYRLFAFLVAPSLSMKHCLCLTGYSMFSWNVALLGSYALDTHRAYLGLHPKIALVLFGIPAAIAQGYVFWQFTPLSINPRHLPSSWQRLADQHSRVADRVFWAIPKLVVLIIVAVTHYQFLWYVARVFLPGRKHFCRLSALMNPASYADILSQKELRQFTMNVLKRGVEKAS